MNTNHFRFAEGSNEDASVLDFDTAYVMDQELKSGREHSGWPEPRAVRAKPSNLSSIWDAASCDQRRL